MTCPVCHAELVHTRLLMASGPVELHACAHCGKIFRHVAGVLVIEHVTKITAETCPRCGDRRVLTDGLLAGCLGCGNTGGADA